MNEKELKIINSTQNEYEDLLVKKIMCDNYVIKKINFSSPTGTGKTKMMADVINKMNDDYFFVITTLSKGQLNRQIKVEIERFTNKNNLLVFGLNDYTKNTIMQADDIMSEIPHDKKIIWFRDEGHINTNRWMEILEEISFKIVNVSATNNINSNDDIKCNFNHTMMLRTVVQSEGEPWNALDKLLEVKEQHKSVNKYNPCAIFRVLDDNILKITIRECDKRKLKYINITDENYDMSDLCRDDNEYDVIINKFKIVEGIDIRRAHVLYMTNEPKNPSTTIQVIGRCRRNALLYRDDIDILAPENEELLNNTRICYCFYNVKGMNIDTDENGDLVPIFCNIISVQELKTGAHVFLKNGVLPNGLVIYEANGETGEFDVLKDSTTGFNELSPNTNIYNNNPYKYVLCNFDKKCFLFDVSDIRKLEPNIWGYCDLLEIKREKFTLSNDRFLNLKKYLETKNSIGFEIKYKPQNTYPYVLEIYDIGIAHNFSSSEYYDINEISNDDLYEKLKRENRIDLKYKRFSTKEELEEYCDNNTFVPYDVEVIFSEKIFNNSEISYYYEQGLIIEPIAVFPFQERNKFIKKYGKSAIYECQRYDDLRCIKAFNDKELSIIGIDTFGYLKNGYFYDWYEEKRVTKKIGKNSKLDQYITRKFNNVLCSIREYTYGKDNSIFKIKKFNSMFGYCVEYFAKFIIRFIYDIEYREKILRDFYICFKEDRPVELRDYKTRNMVIEGLFKIKNEKLLALFYSHIIRYEVILKYQSQMKIWYNLPGTKIPSMSYHNLIKESEFVKKIREYGEKTADFIIRYFDINQDNYEEKYVNNMEHCFFETQHITGVADFVIGDTIIDLKCTSKITEACIKQ